jgi:predicted transglutaminase-like cysteine proteinase
MPMRSVRSHCRLSASRAAPHALVACLSWLLVFAVFGPVSRAQAGPVADGARMQASFFGSIEVRADDISAFRKWRDALQRSAAETAASVDGECGTGAVHSCPYGDWLRFLDRLRGRDRRQQLLAVNHEINKRRYVGDTANYGLEDYWASAGEFLLRDSGDCEDYAIIKFLSLKRLGWSDRELRLVAVKDLQLRIGHAVLIAFDGGKAWLLDNQIGAVTDAREVDHYQPLYSINESAWWRHQPRGWASAAGSATAAQDPAGR